MASGILYVVSNDWIRDPETNDKPYKIGITKSTVDERYYGLGLKMPGIFEILFAYKLEDYEVAEKCIHLLNKKYRVNGEWFKINQEGLDQIKSDCERMGGILVTDDVTDEIDEQTNIDLIEKNKDYSNMKMVKEKSFVYENKKCIVRRYNKSNGVRYYEIFYGDSKCNNTRGFAREFLKAHGENIKEDNNTHTTVEQLISFLEKN